MTITDITGQRFGRLLVLGNAGVRTETAERITRSYWLCLCDCGNQHTVSLSNLKQKNTKSCGCLKRESLKGNRRNRGEANGSI